LWSIGAYFASIAPLVVATDEAKLAAWERSNFNGQKCRDARLQRGACTYCGVSGHKADQCPSKLGAADRDGGWGMEHGSAVTVREMLD